MLWISAKFRVNFVANRKRFFLKNLNGFNYAKKKLSSIELYLFLNCPYNPHLIGQKKTLYSILISYHEYN